MPENPDSVNGGQAEPKDQRERIPSDTPRQDLDPLGTALVTADGSADSTRVEDQLRAQVTLFKSIVEGAADVTTLITPDGTILYASATIAEATSLGYSPNVVVGQSCFDIIHPDDRKGVVEAIARDLAGVPTTVEARSLRRDRTWMWTEMRGKAMVGLDGKAIIVTYSRNIDERKRLQEQLEKSDEFSKALLKGCSDIIVAADLSGSVRFSSDSIRRVLGYTPDEMIGSSIYSFVHEDDVALAAERIARAAYSPNVLTEIRMRRKDNTWCECEGSGHIITAPGGEQLLIFNVRDITERKRAEREVRELATIVNSSTDAIIGFSRDFRISSWNSGAERAFGISASAAIGCGFDLFVPPEKLPQLIEAEKDVLAAGRTETIEVAWPKPDSSLRTWSVDLFPLLDPGGQIIAGGSIGHDISVRKLMEVELVAAREAALAASQAKSEFLSSMSHEIRTPMTAILGMAELLAEGELNAEQRRYIESLGNNGQALLDLINSILDLAKIENGRLTLEHVGLDLCDLVEKAAQTLAIRAHAKGLEMIVNIASDVPNALVGDPLRLRQVLINLIGNAIKFTEKGEVLVSVERNGEPGEEPRLKFSVRDTGIGIAEDKLPALFAAFSQADSSIARKFGGSGLGLAIVKRLVGLMSGEVAVESELGKGSTFSFSAPFEFQPDPHAGEQWPDLSGVRVLIVEGNQAGRAVLRQTLSVRGAMASEPRRMRMV